MSDKQIRKLLKRAGVNPETIDKEKQGAFQKCLNEMMNNQEVMEQIISKIPKGKDKLTVLEATKIAKEIKQNTK